MAMTGGFLADYSSLTLVLLAVAGLIAGMARGFSGFGAALIFVPLAGALAGPKLAGPILLIVDGILATSLIPGAWGLGNRREVLVMAAGALIGIPAGTMILQSFAPLTLRWLISGMAASMLALLLSGWRYRGEPHPLATAGTGLVSGLFSGIAQIGGPPVVSYWLGTGIEPSRLRANFILYFALSTIITLVSYLRAGLITHDVLALALVAGPTYGTGIFLGSRMFGLASIKVFRGASLVLIALAVVLSLPMWGRG
jgi:uncharacterized membrane protein YfcA